MNRPLRGEIWRVKLLHDLGSEIGAKVSRKSGKPLRDRPCLIVSSDFFRIKIDNDDPGERAQEDRFTVAPLTEYTEAHEDTMSHWGVSIINKHHIDIDQRNNTYPGPPQNEQLQIWETDNKGRYIYDAKGKPVLYKSIIDC